jgi:hypothetical protein
MPINANPKVPISHTYWTKHFACYTHCTNQFPIDCRKYQSREETGSGSSSRLDSRHVFLHVQMPKYSFMDIPLVLPEAGNKPTMSL